MTNYATGHNVKWQGSVCHGFTVYVC